MSSAREKWTGGFGTSCAGVFPSRAARAASKGLPTSFLATALLSTQSDVTDVLDDSLQGDPSGTGRELIAAALQAVAQDPLFAAMLRATQARRDEAYTDKGAKKTAKGSVFKVAADRVNKARDEKEEFQRLVDDSEGVEQQLRDLTARRGQREEAVAAATERLATLERLAAQAAALARGGGTGPPRARRGAAHSDGSARTWRRRSEASETWLERWRQQSRR